MYFTHQDSFQLMKGDHIQLHFVGAMFCEGWAFSLEVVGLAVQMYFLFLLAFTCSDLFIFHPELDQLMMQEREDLILFDSQSATNFIESCLGKNPSLHWCSSDHICDISNVSLIKKTCQNCLIPARICAKGHNTLPAQSSFTINLFQEHRLCAFLNRL